MVRKTLLLMAAFRDDNAESSCVRCRTLRGLHVLHVLGLRLGQGPTMAMDKKVQGRAAQ